MINDWKLGMRMLRYAYGVKMNCIAIGLLLLLEIPAIASGRMDGNGFPACYILMVAGMLPVQMLYTLSVASMTQASPMKKKLQTKIPALVNFTMMSAMYLTGGLLSAIMAWGKPENNDLICNNLVMLASSLVVVMLYMGVAYKYMVLATIGMVPLLCIVLIKGLAGNGRLSFLAGSGITLWQAIPGGLVILALGAMAEYLLSRLVYKAPMDKLAQTGWLRKEI